MPTRWSRDRKVYHPCVDKFTFTIPKNVDEARKQISNSILPLILHSNPDGIVSVFDTQSASYARWRNSPIIAEALKGYDWKAFLGSVKDQGPHNTCWAIVIAELISALRYIRGDDQVYTDYSSQFLVDYACPEKRDKVPKKNNHYCYTHNFLKGMKFVKENGLPQEKHWPYKGCRWAPPPAYTPPEDEEDSHVFIASGKSLGTLDKALDKLQHHPIGAALALFSPDYETIMDGIYEGPMYKESVFKGLHAVSIYRVGEENGVPIAYVKSSHGELVGEEGYFKVSLEVMLVEVPKPGLKARKELETPTRLLSLFGYPKLPPKV